MNAERLLKAAFAVRHTSKFEMRDWCHCIAGNYISMFPEEGLELVPTTSQPDSQTHYPAVGYALGYSAVAVHFDIPIDDTYRMFAEKDHNRTAEKAAEQLEQYVRDHSPASEPQYLQMKCDARPAAAEVHNG